MTKENEHHAEHKTGSNDRFASDLETLQNNFGQLREDVTTLLNNAVGTARHGAGALRHRASDAVDDLKDRGADSLEQIGKKIAQQPIASTFIAMGVGFLVAKLFARR
jgi:ElaB/YqjD/DUF883 family membrane-anchored ribosome-binding protein